MLEGQYSAIFFEADPKLATPGREFGRGVVEFREGKVFGGDSGYQYLGSYELLDETGFSGSITVAPHTAQRLHGSAFGARGSTLDIRGSADRVGVRCGGEIRTLGKPFHIKLTRIVG
jgi:hypothetical protein